ncbi:redoxin domain-containing protein [Parapedobacter deserti]|uniref:Redoxin domain-containing protein n=1 Tax=Parapedobacter deserti TaxID=1912957 RepID=A0ABV7JWV9_9SPHI
MMIKPFKATVLALYIVGIFRVVSAQETFELKGMLSNSDMEGGQVLLVYHDGAKTRYDTTKVRKGAFRIAGTVARPTKVLLYVEHPKAPLQPEETKKNDTREFFLERGITSVTGHDVASAKIEGGIAQDEYAELQQQLKRVGWHGVIRTDKNLVAKKDSISIAFVKAHPTSEVSFMLIKQIATPHFLAGHHEEMAQVYDSLSEAWRNSDDGKRIAQQLEVAKKLGIGKDAIDFTMNDTLGNPVSLSDFRGQYVFLDFWASWCAPCRAENKHVVAAYQQFKDKNFTVLGVSLDKAADRQKWIDAIHQDELTWTHVSDLNGWDNAAARAYGVQSIPMNYLIDPEGKIVAVSLRGRVLMEHLEELL